MLGGFYALVKYLIGKSSETIVAERQERIEDKKAEREERKAFIAALNKMAETNQEIAEATKRAADEAKERNGHLAEISDLNRDLVIQAMSHIEKQEVKNQTVEHGIVNNKE